MKKRVLATVMFVFVAILSLSIISACTDKGSGNVSKPGVKLDFETVYAYAVDAGYKGTMEELVELFKGDSAYEIAVNNGYKGTESEWQNVSKNSDWDYKTGNYTVICTDGTIAKDGTINLYEEIAGTEGLEYTLSDDGESYSVTGIGTATDKDIVIPSTYNSKPVTSIGNSAFV